MPEEDMQNPLHELNSLIDSEKDETKNRLLKQIRSSYVQLILMPENKTEGELLFNNTMYELYDDDGNLKINFDEPESEIVTKYITEIDESLYPKEDN